MNPVSELQQCCDRNKYAITYADSMTGASHEASHTCKVCVRINENETLVCEETDTRKHLAKAKVAKSMLISLNEFDTKRTINSSSVLIRTI